MLEDGEVGSVYNLGAGSEVSGIEVADTVIELCGRPPSLKHFVDDRPGHDYRYALDVQRAQTLGWKPKVSFAEGMRQTVAWYQANENWWRRRKSAEFWDYYRRNYKSLPADALPT